MRALPIALVMIGCLAGAASITALERRVVPRDRLGEDLMYYPSGPAIRKVALGHTSSAADLAWLKAVQYYGEHKRTDRKFIMMGHIFEIITDLDPLFQNAYIFGGLVTAEEGQDVPGGLRLMEKGIRNNPESWRLEFETGFMYRLFTKDMDTAARHFRRAAAFPDAPDRAARFAAFMAARGGDRQAALMLWKYTLERTTNDIVREKAVENIRKLEEEIARESGS